MAPAANALSTRQWFASKHIPLLNGWPANSPDLSPIEQIWGIAKRYIIQLYGMRTPIPNDQLEKAVFEAYRLIEPETIAVLTRSVKFRVQLCVARGGLFVGDALEECCRRAKAELEPFCSVDIHSIIPTFERGQEDGHGDEEGTDIGRLPSFISHL